MLATRMRMSAGGVAEEEVAVDRTAGTAIGNMTEVGGLAASFDGVTSQAAAASSRATDNTPPRDGYIGKDWGAGNTKKISKFAVTCPSDARFDGGGSNVNVTFDLEGSSDGSSWTQLSTDTVSNNANGQTVTITDADIDTSTKYRYHRIKISHSSANNRIYNSECEFWELV